MEPARPDLVDHVAVLNGPIDLQRLVAAVADPGAGAIASFLGVTRDNFQGEPPNGGGAVCVPSAEASDALLNVAQRLPSL